MLAPKLQLKRTNDTIRARKQRKDVKSADQSDTTIIEVFTQNEIPEYIQETSIKIEADEYTDFHLDDLIA